MDIVNTDMVNVELAKNMDKALHGPKLFCEFCSYLEVLSPCHYCQYRQYEKDPAEYCRGCGNYPTGCKGLEKCQNLSSHH